MKLITMYEDFEYTYSNYPSTKSSGIAIEYPLKQRKIFLSRAEPFFIKVKGAVFQRSVWWHDFLVLLLLISFAKEIQCPIYTHPLKYIVTCDVEYWFFF